MILTLPYIYLEFPSNLSFRVCYLGYPHEGVGYAENETENEKKRTDIQTNKTEKKGLTTSPVRYSGVCRYHYSTYDTGWLVVEFSS